MKWIRLSVAVAGLLATAIMPAAVRTAAAAPLSKPGASPVPALDWRACDGGFQCATARVPLDYRHPGGTTISLAVVRHLAGDPARRLGAMFVNLGGPMEQIQPFTAGFSTIPRASAGPVRHHLL